MIDSLRSLVCAREERRSSFYIAFRLPDDLNPGIDNRWNRSLAGSREGIRSLDPELRRAVEGHGRLI